MLEQAYKNIIMKKTKGDRKIQKPISQDNLQRKQKIIIESKVSKSTHELRKSFSAVQVQESVQRKKSIELLSQMQKKNQDIIQIEYSQEEKIVPLRIISFEQSDSDYKEESQKIKQQVQIQFPLAKIKRTLSEPLLYKVSKKGQNPEKQQKQQKDQTKSDDIPHKKKLITLQFVDKESLVSLQQMIDFSKQKQCQLCYQYQLLEDFDQPFKCKHQFCRECLTKYLKRLIYDHKIIVCPSEECDEQINFGSDTYTKLEEKQHKKYQKIVFEFQVLKDKNLALCPNNNCQNKGVIQKSAKSSNKGKCRQCKITYCLQCMVQEHWGKCTKNQAQFLNDKYKYQKCISCKRIIERKAGCPHITCICGYQFCYGCGSRWQYSHNCWRNRLGQHKSIFDKISQRVQGLKFEGQDTCLGHYAKNLPYYLAYGSLVFLWFLWCILFALIIYPLIFLGCFVFGYIFAVVSLCKQMKYRCAPKVFLFLLILFMPVCFVVAGFVCFIAFCKEKSSSFFVDPCFRGELFPIFKCRLS